MKQIWLLLLLGVVAFAPPSPPWAGAVEGGSSPGSDEVLQNPATYQREAGEPGVLSILSRPEGARVFVDGEEKGTTPLYVRDLGEGEHEVILYLPGKGAFRQTLEGPGGRIFVDLDEEAGIGIGLVAVTTDPADARVEVDGKPVGLAPLEVPLQAGRHVIRATKQGFQPAEAAVEVVPAAAGQEVALTLAPEDGALLVVSSPDGGQVLVDDEPRGAAQGPLRVEPVAPGVHRVRVELEGYRPWERDDVVVTNGRTTTVIAALVPVRNDSSVRLYTDPPGARVWLDGREIGRAGKDGLGFRAPKGLHRLRLVFDPAERPGYTPLEVTVPFRDDVEDFRDRPLRIPPVDESYANAQKLIERGQIEEALGFLGRVPPDHPSFARARVQVVDLLARAGRVREIPPVLAELVARPETGRNPALNLALGYWCWQAARQADPGEAVALLRQGAKALERAVSTPELLPAGRRQPLLLKAYYYLGVTSERLFQETGEARFIQKGAQAWQVFFARLEQAPDAMAPEWVERARRHRRNLEYLATKLGG